MGLAEIWSLAFSSFELFVGVGLLWLMFVERLFPDRGLSVALMTLTAAVTAVAFFCHGWRKARRERLAAQAKMEAADTLYEDEVG